MPEALVIGGGQASLTAAQALRSQGFQPTIVHAGTEPVGSWPHYYDSLRLFTPAWMNALPGMPFPGPPDRFPSRDDVVSYLRAYAATLDCEIRTQQRVVSVTAHDDGFVASTACGSEYAAPVLVAASGSFDRPHRPELSILDCYAGKVLHSADYRSPEPFVGQRVVVVGAGNSAVQIAVELAGYADVTLASRKPVRYLNTAALRPDGRYWRALLPVARLPIAPIFSRAYGTLPVLDTNGYRAAIEGSHPARCPMFTGAEGTELRWPDGTREHVDTIILATGYRPAVQYLRPLGALDEAGLPKQHRGLSTVRDGLGFVGLEGMRTFVSSALHGVGLDARHVARQLRLRLTRGGAVR